MPGFDGTGPRGMGPMTGRGRGYCMSYIDANAGFFCGFGRGRGWRNRYYATGLPWWARRPAGNIPAGAVYAPPAGGEQELNFLKEQAIYLENALEQVKARIKDLFKKFEGKEKE
ncbi:MAG: DUF5320 domain-containing protein [Pelotomaculum sp.]|uniref:DUF5320 domain-containing protein n=1 Tax=Pelotomaculum thermopropionicum (strain DSM 13744 / JCM 10971 / SI) TaxID=370438 RepID=A5D4Q5_PELTS|nr:DUF5320 domain-containing protein [Pelotomaculum sp.]BAF58764.1 hypothetical protein PTH_0583 [Pelotomaculum thermopropionicum SI]